jgi:short-subunit dehydrogenase
VKEVAMPALPSCRGTTVLVTGASSGLGRLLAVRFAREGARAVALVARRADVLEAVSREVVAAGAEPFVLPCDVAERGEVFAAAERVLARFGAVDVLVNNAGYGRHRRFLEWDLDDMERMLRVNFLGTLYWTKALLPRMVERRRGWLVFMASVGGRIGVPEESAYAASKFAMVGLAEALSVEVEDAGVHVLTVCPGAIRTPFFGPEELERMPPVAKRSMIEPEPVIEAVMRALRRGAREITVPRGIAAAYLVRAIAPGFMRRSTKRVTLDAMARARRT